ncbi:serine hydrolase FSH [Aspergillus avenaceus]|uniref:Serine hydrolase FSH n=1 Tax=Aspergillus avenaceus TaxID=36643 RepID=A0A5N6TQB1_ASPAV|nr:serine hydrolase FSH [Aspergillus avenaceus]
MPGLNHFPEQDNLHLPRILCLHGGGTNSVIFRAQCRVLITQLKQHFRLVFADAPFPSQPGPDVVSVYKDFGPFRRWLRSGPEHPVLSHDEAVAEIDRCLGEAMDADEGYGEWVGVLGFSQGAKVAASLLFRQQVRTARLGKHASATEFRFGVLMAGRGPLVSFEPELLMNDALVTAEEIDLLRAPSPQCLARKEHILRFPTIHVHGMLDPGIERHRQLLRTYCCPNASRLMQWEGNHRVPIKTKDVSALVREMLEVAVLTEAL